MKAVIESILKSIREGSTFSDALQKHPRIFPRLYVNMVRAGEAGGVLDVVLEKLNEFQESTKELKESVFSAMIYPAVLLITGCISIVIILTFVIPKFSAIFTELGAALPLPTQILLAVSDTLRTWWWVGVLLVCGGWLMVRGYLKTDAGRYQWDAMKLRLLRDVITKLETARFCRTLGTLLRSGVSMLPALNNARDVITNRVIASAVASVSKGAKEGKGIGGPLADSRAFPTLALSMIKVGEETGQLDVMLLKVATTYEKSLREALKRFIDLFSPIMILGMGLVIGFIVVSMLMAIFSISELPM
jgi:general secretion pathway protein F